MNTSEMKRVIRARLSAKIETKGNQSGYTWIDRGLLNCNCKFTGKPKKLSEIWKEIMGCGMIAIIRLEDKKIIYMRGM